MRTFPMAISIAILTSCTHERAIQFPALIEKNNSSGQYSEVKEMQAAFNYVQSISMFYVDSFPIISKNNALFDLQIMFDSSKAILPLRILVDTVHKTAYTSGSIDSETAEFFGIETRDSYNQYCLPIYILNDNADTLLIDTQDGSVIMIQEALDELNIWKPIEYWFYSSCGNSYYSHVIPQNYALLTKAPIYTGDFKTKIRFKLKNLNNVYYSESFIGSINKSQFIPPNNLKDLGLRNTKEAMEYIFLNE